MPSICSSVKSFEECVDCCAETHNLFVAGDEYELQRAQWLQSSQCQRGNLVTDEPTVGDYPKLDFGNNIERLLDCYMDHLTPLKRMQAKYHSLALSHGHELHHYCCGDHAEVLASKSACDTLTNNQADWDSVLQRMDVLRLDADYISQLASWTATDEYQHNDVFGHKPALGRYPKLDLYYIMDEELDCYIDVNFVFTDACDRFAALSTHYGMPKHYYCCPSKRAPLPPKATRVVVLGKRKISKILNQRENPNLDLIQ
jgi:hypothetical protein